MKFLNLSIHTGTFVMAVIWLMLAFMFLPTPEDARLQSLERRCTDFSKAEALAKEDFKNGRYHISRSGEKSSSVKTQILDSILRAEFKIVPLYTGCVGTSCTSF